jgi:hypothetical protein
LEALFVELFLEAHAKPRVEIVLVLDATDDPLHRPSCGVPTSTPGPDRSPKSIASLRRFASD